MAGKIAPFMDGSQLVIKVDGRKVAFCESLSFNDNMQVQTTFGIGSYGPHTVEPLSYNASGSMRILRYSSEAFNNLGSDATLGVVKNIPSAGKNNVNPRGADGNSMLWLNSFSPLRMLLETTFDIEVYTRTVNAQGQESLIKSFVLEDCLVQSIGIGFNPGALVSENISFTCLRIIDQRAQTGKTRV